LHFPNGEADLDGVIAAFVFAAAGGESDGMHDNLLCLDRVPPGCRNTAV
jgi:hypothetical protein